MDGFAIWLVTAILMSWVAGNPATPPSAPLKETVILLPDAEGKSTGVVVDTGKQQTAVTEPFHAVELSGGKIADRVLSAEEVQKLYPDVMQALPEKPRSFTLRFEENGTKLTDDSLAIVAEVRQEIGKRAAPEVTVIGHTDRAGSAEDNLRLSVQRAAAVRDMLVAGGIAANLIQIVGRGELEPAVATEDGVAEPRNRRVEITVR